VKAYFALLPIVLAACLNGCGEKRPPPNILLVTVDTLRADRLKCNGYPITTSPTVDALAERGLCFTRCIAHASSTAPALASVMTGLYPSEAGVPSNAMALSDSVETLALAMKRNGFHTSAYVSNFILQPRWRFQRGFEHYDAKMIDSEANRSFVVERNAEKTTDAALKGLEKQAKAARPFFLWIHYNDPHGPYTPPEEFLAPSERYAENSKTLPALDSNWGMHGIPAYQLIEEKKETAFYSSRYDGEVRFFDSQLGRLIHRLEQLDLLKNTVVVFTADHGESMGEHGYWYSHEQDLFNELIRVPLILAVPGVPPAKRNEPVCHIDLFPTLLTLAGVDDPDPESYRGKDLLSPKPLPDNRPIYSETLFIAKRTFMRSLTLGRWKLIRSTNNSVPPALFDLDGDPEEKNNLYQERPKVAQNMMKILKAEEKRASPENISEPLDLTDEEKEALKALGYTR
jgi:arylsulfatase A-like enzyme